MARTLLARPPAGDRDAVAEAGGRLGLAARGGVYLLVAVLGVRVALGRSGDDRADQRGALAEVAEHPFGTVVLVLLAVGFAGYAAWRVYRAWHGEGGGEPEPHERAADLGRAAVYAALLLSTVAVLRGDGAGGSGGGGGDAQGWTARLMEQGWGRWAVGLAGAAVVAGGLWLVRSGLDQRFREHLERLSPAIVRLGVAGHVARGVAFVVIGGFVVRAAVRFDPQEPVGLDGALRELASSGGGRVVAVGVALGLGAFGLYSLAEARHRRVVE